MDTFSFIVVGSIVFMYGMVKKSHLVVLLTSGTYSIQAVVGES